MAQQVPQATNACALEPALDQRPRFQNLCESLAADPDFLQLRPILATSDGTVFAGNTRLRAAQHLGRLDVPAILVDIPEQLAKERAMRDNAQWGEWEKDDLAKLLQGAARCRAHEWSRQERREHRDGAEFHEY